MYVRLVIFELGSTIRALAEEFDATELSPVSLELYVLAMS
jgi:hypothetical protein